MPAACKLRRRRQLCLTTLSASVVSGVAGCCGAAYADMMHNPCRRQMLVLIGQEVTLRDDKARKELGYKSHISVDEGMQEISRKAKK